MRSVHSRFIVPFLRAVSSFQQVPRFFFKKKSRTESRHFQTSCSMTDIVERSAKGLNLDGHSEEEKGDEEEEEIVDEDLVIETTSAEPTPAEEMKETNPFVTLMLNASGSPPTVFFPYCPYLNQKRYISDRRVVRCKPSSRVYYWSKWKRNIIKCAFRAAGVEESKKRWDVYWGSQVRTRKWAQTFGAIDRSKKINHFPGTWCLGRKDRLARNIRNMQRKFGAVFRFIPETFVWPRDEDNFKRFLGTDQNIRLFIKKPVASSRGRGIKVHAVKHAALVLRKLRKMQSKKTRQRSYLLQRYISNPLTINHLKFDVRLYVVCTSVNPLVLFLFRDGLVRFCTVPFRPDVKSKESSRMHLTNYSLQKKSKTFMENQDVSRDDEGHKWSFTAMLRHLHSERGVNTDELTTQIERLIVKTFISADEEVNAAISVVSRSLDASLGGSCFELFGFDVMIDNDMKPWLIEVNTSPSLSANSPLDKKIKGVLFTDMLHLIGLSPPHVCSSPDRPAHNIKTSKKKRTQPVSGLSARLQHVLSTAHVGAIPRAGRKRRRSIEEFREIPLSKLHPDDVAMIKTLEGQIERCGHFKPIFPTPQHADLYKHFIVPRRANALMRRWTEERRKRRAGKSRRVRDIPRLPTTHRAALG